MHAGCTHVYENKVDAILLASNPAILTSDIFFFVSVLTAGSFKLFMSLPILSTLISSRNRSLERRSTCVVDTSYVLVDFAGGGHFLFNFFFFVSS